MNRGGRRRLSGGDKAESAAEGRSAKRGKRYSGARAQYGFFASRWKRSRLFRVSSIVLCVLLVLVATGFVLAKTMLVLPDIEGDSNPVFEDAEPDVTFEGDDLLPEDQEPVYKVTPSPVPTPSPLKLRENVYTVLLAATFDDGNTDTLMVATLDRDAKTLDVISVPRDTSTLWNNSIVKINSIYGRGGSGEKGMTALENEISALLGFKPNNFAMIKMNGFKKLVNTIGGVEFTIPFNMIHLDKDDSKSIRLSKGTQTLNGDEALQLMRFRVSDPGSGGGSYDDYGRMKTQQQFLMAVFKKMTKLGNLTKVLEYAKIAAEMLNPTDLAAGEMLAFATEIMGLKSENINFHTLPTVTSNKSYFENVDAEAALKLINETVNPYTEPITPDMTQWPEHP